MAEENATKTAAEPLTAEEFGQVQAVLGGRGYAMVSFEMDGFFARFDNVRQHDRLVARRAGGEERR